MRSKSNDVVILSAPEKRRQKFWSRVNKTEECWLFTGPLPKNKYAPFSFNYTQMNGHRAVLLWATGHAMPSMQANHRCLNKHCVNPKHLYWGTGSENMKDRIRDNRCPVSGRVGEDHMNATLTNATVLHIWVDLMFDPRGIGVIAKKYGTTTGNVSAIKGKKSYKSITDRMPDLPNINDLSKWPEFQRKPRDPLSEKEIATICEMIDSKIALRQISKHTKCADTTLRQIYFRERGVFPKPCVNRGFKPKKEEGRAAPRYWAQRSYQAAGDISPSS